MLVGVRGDIVRFFCVVKRLYCEIIMLSRRVNGLLCRVTGLLEGFIHFLLGCCWVPIKQH